VTDFSSIYELYVLNVNYYLKVVIVLLSTADVGDFTLKPETDYDVLRQYV